VFFLCDHTRKVDAPLVVISVGAVKRISMPDRCRRSRVWSAVGKRRSPERDPTAGPPARHLSVSPKMRRAEAKRVGQLAQTRRSMRPSQFVANGDGKIDAPVASYPSLLAQAHSRCVRRTHENDECFAPTALAARKLATQVFSMPDNSLSKIININIP
jgi:hypothetical protein